MKLFFFLILLFLVHEETNANCTLPAPSTLSITNVASCQITMNWSSVTGAAYYTIKYKASTASIWTVISNAGTVTSYTIEGLNGNTTYNVKVAAVCTNNTSGKFKSGSKKTTSCSTPINLAAANITTSSATVSWLALCGTSTFNFKYKLHSVSTWTTISNLNATSYNLTGLLTQMSYDVQVLAVCGNVKSKATSTLTFTTQAAQPLLKGKNVLFILIDDSRRDPFAPDGGPAFFSNPNITRIANEGVRFKWCFPSESQCAPSRSSIYTGDYPHKTGILNNYTYDSLAQTTLAEILHDNNYYTGLIGKYHLAHAPEPGYDYWMENHLTEYFNQSFNINGNDKTILGHKTDVVTDSAIGFLHKVPSGKSFYLEVAYAAPHIPYEPRPQDDSLYLNDNMPLASNPDYYTENYPNLDYVCNAGPNNETLNIRKYYQMLAGVEYSVGRLLNELTNMNLLDSTLIIFTSDNGYILGEHHMDGKRLAYEKSIDLPLYMRYPSKIAAGSMIDNEMAMNIDFAPTILDYVGIANPAVMDGISLKKVIEGTQHRTEMFYEFFNEDCDPDIRAVRSFNYKYIEYGCNTTTEELFDLVNDPVENTNLVNNAAYDSLLNVYRDKLTYWENYYAYTTRPTIPGCFLSNPFYERTEVQDDESDVPVIKLFPNPSTSQSELFVANMGDAAYAVLTIKTILGEEIGHQTVSLQHGRASVLVSTQNFNAGIYLLNIKAGMVEMNARLVVE